MVRLFFTSFVITVMIITINASRVTLKHNGYSDLVVAISPDIPSNQSQLIIENIQSMIRDASKVLFLATGQRAYFKNVNILVPNFWTNIRAIPSTWEVYNKAEVKIAPASSAYQDTPYTIQLGGCGDPGDHIHLTPQYVATLNKSENVAVFGPAGKVFVHEWAHLRYGVFDEYGIRGDASYPLFYRPQSTSDRASMAPNLCADNPAIFTTKDVSTQSSCKLDQYTGLYDENCTFSLDESFKPTSSLMSYHSVDSVVKFCDDSNHNAEAPNKHNVMCNSRSVWSIIMDHEDFALDNNPPNNASDFIFPDPVFTVVRSGLGSRYVLVIDVSGSMSDDNRISRVYESARRWIRYDFPDGSELGIVQFDTRSTITANLTLVDNVDTRLYLMDKVPSSANGGTCIGCGLLSGLLVLKESGPGGVIVLISDGEENDSPTMSDITPFIVDAEVRVVSVAFGRQAEEKIENLSTDTDGKSYFVDDNDSQGLSNALIGSLIYEPVLPSGDITVKLFQQQYTSVGQSITGNFSVDFSVGRETTIRLDYQNKQHIVSLSVVSPEGIIYSSLMFDTVAKIAYIQVPDVAKGGVWRFSLVVSNSASDTVAVLVTSRARSSTETPITSRCYIPNGATGVNATTTPLRIVSAVMQGRNPVLGAKVKAFIKEPSGKVTSLDLFDNGVFGDTTRNDGVYSRHFVTATSLGRYSVECEVSDGGSAYINEGFKASSVVVKDPDVPYCCGSNVPVGGIRSTGPFTRVNSCGEFKIKQIVGNLNDSYPPARVTDLQVLSMNYTSMVISIRFTAPGDDLDFGIVQQYEIRYSSKFREMTEDNFDIGANSVLIQEKDLTIPGSLIPKSSGSEQIVTFVARNGTQLDTTYYVAMRAIDKADRFSPLSNVASFQITDVTSGTTAQNANLFVLAISLALYLLF